MPELLVSIEQFAKYYIIMKLLEVSCKEFLEDAADNFFGVVILYMSLYGTTFCNLQSILLKVLSKLRIVITNI